MFMWWYNRKLRSRDLSVVVTAAQKLRERYGEKAVVPLKRAVPKLIAALSHSIPEIRETAITMLGYLGDQRAAEPLVRVLSKARTNPTVRAEVVEALGSINDPTATDGVLSAMNDPDYEVLKSVCRALQAMRSPVSVPNLIELSKHNDPSVSTEAFGALLDFDCDLAQQARTNKLATMSDREVLHIISDAQLVVRMYLDGITEIAINGLQELFLIGTELERRGGEKEKQRILGLLATERIVFMKADAFVSAVNALWNAQAYPLVRSERQPAKRSFLRVVPHGKPLQHEGEVRVVAFSPDGLTVLTGSEDETAQLWDAQTGEPRGKPLRHHLWVDAVAFSPDGGTVLTGSDGHAARLWDAQTGKSQKWLKHEGRVTAVAFSPDGLTVFTGSEDNTARLWDAQTGEPRGEPLRHQGKVRTVAFSPDGRTVVTGSEDGSARLWDAQTGNPRGKPLYHGDYVTALAFSPDGRTVLTGCHGSKARLWNSQTGEPRSEWLLHAREVRVVAFSPDGRTVLTGSDDHTAQLWDAPTSTRIGEELRHDDRVCAVAFSPDAETIVTGSYDMTARLWDAQTGESLSKPMRHKGAVLTVVFSPDGRVVLTGSVDKTARLWDLTA